VSTQIVMRRLRGFLLLLMQKTKSGRFMRKARYADRIARLKEPVANLSLRLRRRHPIPASSAKRRRARAPQRSPQSNLISDAAVFQGFCGSLANLILFNATAGVASGALADVGINDHFMKELTAALIPSSSALFVLTRSPTPDRDRLLEEVKGLGGKILMTSLSHEDEARLQAASSAQKSAGP